MYYCKKCGAALTPEKRFCSQCGTPVEEIASTAQPTTPQAETPAATTAQPAAPPAVQSTNIPPRLTSRASMTSFAITEMCENSMLQTEFEEHFREVFGFFIKMLLVPYFLPKDCSRSHRFRYHSR